MYSDTDKLSIPAFNSSTDAVISETEDDCVVRLECDNIRSNNKLYENSLLLVLQLALIDTITDFVSKTTCLL